MWLLFALVTLLFWSGSDLFSKIGCQDPTDRPAPLKMVVAVGFVMGLHAMYQIFVGGVPFSLDVVWSYLPVSALYIISMTIGYFGLRYIELSITSPICNSSGAVVVLLYLLMGERPGWQTMIALALVIGGVFGLSLTEFTEDEETRRKRQEKANRKYAKSALAIALPVLYCIIDALGTFGDSLVLEHLEEEQANVAYELTFLTVGILVLIYLLATKKFTFRLRQDGAKLTGAVSETIGQFFYIFAIGSNAVLAAPVISCYCLLSVVWSRIFLKEHLSWKHYLSIAVAIVGILLLGIFNPDA